MRYKQSIVGLLLMASACAGPRFTSEHFQFARERDNLAHKAVIQVVPDDITDNMVYYCRSGVYNNRQVVFKGVSTRTLIRAAYQTTASRMMWNVNVPDSQLIAEIIIPNPDRDALQQELIRAVESKFDIRMSREVLTIPVFELRPMEGAEISLREVDASRIRWTQTDGRIAGTGMTLGMVSQVLETVLDSRPVVPAGFGRQRYEITLVWEPGDVESLKEALEAIGLQLVDRNLPIEMMVIDSRTP